MVRSAVASAALIGLAIACGATSAHAEEPRARAARAPVPLDGIAAVVDDVFVFRSDVNARVRHYEATLSKDPTKRRAELAAMEKALVAKIIDELLIAKDAKALHIEVTDAEVSAGVTSVAQANNLNRKALETEVQKAGFTLAEYQEEIRRQIAEQKWLIARASG
jgi:peptidyl-prolyl cis-trans isomerase SurA